MPFYFINICFLNLIKKLKDSHPNILAYTTFNLYYFECINFDLINLTKTVKTVIILFILL